MAPSRQVSRRPARASTSAHASVSATRPSAASSAATQTMNEREANTSWTDPQRRVLLWCRGVKQPPMKYEVLRPILGRRNLALRIEMCRLGGTRSTQGNQLRLQMGNNYDPIQDMVACGIDIGTARMMAGPAPALTQQHTTAVRVSRVNTTRRASQITSQRSPPLMSTALPASSTSDNAADGAPTLATWRSINAPVYSAAAIQPMSSEASRIVRLPVAFRPEDRDQVHLGAVALSAAPGDTARATVVSSDDTAGANDTATRATGHRSVSPLPSVMASGSAHPQTHLSAAVSSSTLLPVRTVMSVTEDTPDDSVLTELASRKPSLRKTTLQRSAATEIAANETAAKRAAQMATTTPTNGTVSSRATPRRTPPEGDINSRRSQSPALQQMALAVQAASQSPRPLPSATGLAVEPPVREDASPAPFSPEHAVADILLSLWRTPAYDRYYQEQESAVREDPI